jgi:hypothetical protein
MYVQAEEGSAPQPDDDDSSNDIPAFCAGLVFMYVVLFWKSLIENDMHNFGIGKPRKAVFSIMDRTVVPSNACNSSIAINISPTFKDQGQYVVASKPLISPKGRSTTR